MTEESQQLIKAEQEKVDVEEFIVGTQVNKKVASLKKNNLKGKKVSLIPCVCDIMLLVF